jgi:hypoxanthine phosphoribosyltransferase
MPSLYEQQVRMTHNIDLDFWRQPEGVSVPDDELSFLLVPDAIESAMVNDVANQVFSYQSEVSGPEQITRALIVTMGGMLPGILLYDHLVEGRADHHPTIAFGTVGVALYKGPGEQLENPQIQQDVSIPIAGETVLLVDDLIDRGGTMRFLTDHVLTSGARKVLRLVLYIKPAAAAYGGAEFFFGELAQDTWLITPRELVETLAKRVPVWRQRGATEGECRRRLVDIIGYPEQLTDQYLPAVYARKS